jgi:multidrug efflux pump subunit AcrA (membrane-fusion protein)
MQKARDKLGRRWARLTVRMRMLVGVGAAVLVLAAGVALYLRLNQPAVTEEAPMQTTVARQGDLTISATGSGTLTATEEKLGFTGNGEMTVTGVYVRAGDLVQEGDVLAEVNSQQAELQYQEAQRAYAELTSTTAQANALRQEADAQAKLQSAKWQLEYLISPDVMYWETQIADAQETLKAAKAQRKQTPSDQEAKKTIVKETAFIDFAEDKLADAWKDYYDEYVPRTFGIKEDLDVDTYNVPSELEVTRARTAIDKAEETLADAKELYDVLMGAPMPEDTTNASLLKIRDAKKRLADAQANLEGSKIIAPFPGTVMQVNAAGGDIVEMAGGQTSTTQSQTGTAGTVVDPILAALTGASSSAGTSSSDTTGSAEGVIVLADTSQPYLEVYWNESDWAMLKVGSAVEIIFDDRPDDVFSGKITEVDRELTTSNGSSVIRGEVSLDSPFAKVSLPVGASASVEVVSERADNAVLIPLEALHETKSGTYMVFVLADGKVRLREVKVGLKNDTYAQITSGLQAGEVVTTGLVKVQ